ncbi:MAG: secondary thiamine-phosphate synthase enzyme YjbQ [Thermodesulfobacteriota bacterium]
METGFSVTTTASSQLLDITARVSEAIASLDLREGAVMVFVPHTTAGVTINEAADPDVAADLTAALERMVPSGMRFRHAEGNSPAHLRASLVGSSVLVPVSRGRLCLGTWQGIFFCEFDGPRTRRVLVRGLAS